MSDNTATEPAASASKAEDPPKTAAAETASDVKSSSAEVASPTSAASSGSTKAAHDPKHAPPPGNNALYFKEDGSMNPDLVTTLQSMVKAGAKLVEFRMPLPLEVNEYQIAQLYSVAKAQVQGTGGGEGVEVLQNEPYDDGTTTGQVTHKIYHVASQTPKVVRAVVSADKLSLREHSWNSYPNCRTYSTHDHYPKDFRIEVITVHLPDNGKTENALGLPSDLLAKREVIHLDIAAPLKKHVVKAEDPAQWTSEKTGRGPLSPGWANSTESIMTAYKIVCIKFKWFGLQNIVQNFLCNYQKGVLTKMHRQLVTSMDEWHGMSMGDLRKYEDKTKAELERNIKSKEKKQYTDIDPDEEAAASK